MPPLPFHSLPSVQDCAANVGNYIYRSTQTYPAAQILCKWHNGKPVTMAKVGCGLHTSAVAMTTGAITTAVGADTEMAEVFKELAAKAAR